MTDAAEPKARHPCRACLGLLAGLAVCALAGLGWAMHVIDKVWSGQGLQTYRAFGWIEFNYVGAFVLILGICGALLIGLALQLREWWLWRDLKKKYGQRQ